MSLPEDIQDWERDPTLEAEFLPILDIREDGELLAPDWSDAPLHPHPFERDYYDV